MIIEFKKSFLKDIKKIKDKEIKLKIMDIIKKIEENRFKELNLKKLSGYNDFYRIKLKKYRLGIKKNDKKTIFVRLLHRKDIYKYFP